MKSKLHGWYTQFVILRHPFQNLLANWWIRNEVPNITCQIAHTQYTSEQVAICEIVYC